MEEIDNLFDAIAKVIQDEATKNPAQAAMATVALRLVQIVAADLHRAADALELIARNTAPSDTGL